MFCYVEALHYSRPRMPQFGTKHAWYFFACLCLGKRLEMASLGINDMRKIDSILMVVILGATINIHAQSDAIGSFNSNLALVQAAAPDSIVQITADAQGLPLVSPGQAPRSGTFWWILAKWHRCSRALPAAK